MANKKIRITKWQHEDEMTEKTMYDALYPLSEVRITRMFPNEIEVLKEPTEEEKWDKLDRILIGLDYSYELYRNEEGWLLEVYGRKGREIIDYQQTEDTREGVIDKALDILHKEGHE